MARYPRSLPDRLSCEALVVRRDHVAVHAPAIGGDGDLIAYGQWGRPVLAFPSQEGRAWDYEDRGMIASIAHLIDAGRVKVYCVDSFDSGSWHRADLSLEERARTHGLYEDWIINQVVPWIFNDCGGPQELIATGCSF